MNPVQSHTRVEVDDESSLTSSDFETAGFLVVVDTVGFLVVVVEESSLTLLLSPTTARLTRKVEDDCLTQYLSNDLTKVVLIKETLTTLPFKSWTRRLTYLKTTVPSKSSGGVQVATTEFLSDLSLWVTAFCGGGEKHL